MLELERDDEMKLTEAGVAGRPENWSPITLLQLHPQVIDFT